MVFLIVFCVIWAFGSLVVLAFCEDINDMMDNGHFIIFWWIVVLKKAPIFLTRCLLKALKE